MHYDNTTRSSGIELVNMFVKYKTDSNTNFDLQAIALSFVNNNLSEFRIIISSVNEKRCKLDITTGSGPDVLPPSLIKHCSFFVLPYSIFEIFRFKVINSQLI